MMYMDSISEMSADPLEIIESEENFYNLLIGSGAKERDVKLIFSRLILGSSVKDLARDEGISHARTYELIRRGLDRILYWIESGGHASDISNGRLWRKELKEADYLKELKKQAKVRQIEENRQRAKAMEGLDLGDSALDKKLRDYFQAGIMPPQWMIDLRHSPPTIRGAKYSEGVLGG